MKFHLLTYKLMMPLRKIDITWDQRGRFFVITSFLVHFVLILE